MVRQSALFGGALACGGSGVRVPAAGVFTARRSIGALILSLTPRHGARHKRARAAATRRSSSTGIRVSWQNVLTVLREHRECQAALPRRSGFPVGAPTRPWSPASNGLGQARNQDAPPSRRRASPLPVQWGRGPGCRAARNGPGLIYTPAAVSPAATGRSSGCRSRSGSDRPGASAACRARASAQRASL